MRIANDNNDGDPAWPWRGRVPSLDGLRGVSILLVLFAHLNEHFSTTSLFLARHHAEIGSIGVDVFFVISGFLITLLLEREWRKTEDVSLLGFYIRRAFRIIPAYVVYVGTIGLLLAFTSGALPASTWARVATYSVSLFKLNSWYVDHTWSLSVEEHFYLLWPLLFRLLPHRWRLLLCLAYSVLAVVTRIALVKFISLDIHPSFFSPVRGDAIAAGCALALFAVSSHRRRLCVKPGAAVGIAAVAFAALVLSFLSHGHVGRLSSYYSNFGYRFVNEWCIVVLVWAAVYYPRSPLGRVLNSRSLMTVGLLSYSIYLWQQPFLGPLQPFWLFKVPMNLVAIAVFSAASYLFIERPFLQLKSRFEPTSEARQRSEYEARRLTAPVR